MLLDPIHECAVLVGGVVLTHTPVAIISFPKVNNIWLPVILAALKRQNPTFAVLHLLFGEIHNLLAHLDSFVFVTVLDCQSFAANEMLVCPFLYCARDLQTSPACLAAAPRSPRAEGGAIASMTTQVRRCRGGLTGSTAGRRHSVRAYTASRQ